MALNPDIEFQTVETVDLQDVNLSDENLYFIQETGFLGWVSPHLYFGDFENGQLLPRLENWSWIDEWKTDKKLAIEKFGSMLVVGSGPDSEPLLMVPGESPIYMLSSSLELLFLNTNLQNLTATASAFLDMIDSALEQTHDAVQKCIIPVVLVNKFISTYKSIEKLAESNNLWVQWANERSKNL